MKRIRMLWLISMMAAPAAALNATTEPSRSVYRIDATVTADGRSTADTLTMQDPVVNEGLVNAALAFAEAPYNAQALGIEARALSGATMGAYAALDPRQVLTPTPCTLFASARSPVCRCLLSHIGIRFDYANVHAPASAQSTIPERRFA